MKLLKAIINLLSSDEINSTGGMHCVEYFFLINGSATVEVALKMVYQYWQNKGQTLKKIISFKSGCHGDTFEAMAVDKTSDLYKKFEGLLFDVDFMPFPATWIGDNKAEKKESEA